MADHESDSELDSAVLVEEDETPELRDGGIARRLLAEFLGTFFLSLVLASASGPTAPALVGVSAAVLSLLFGPVSGGHFNPVVTVSLGLLGRIRAELAWLYLFVQFAAGFAGFALVWALRPPLDEPARTALRESVDRLVGAKQGEVPWLPGHWPLMVLAAVLLVAAVLAARGAFREQPQAGAWTGAAWGVAFWFGLWASPAASLPELVFNGYASAFQAAPALLLLPLVGSYAGALVYRELVAHRPEPEPEAEEHGEDGLDESGEEADQAEEEFEAADDGFVGEPDPVRPDPVRSEDSQQHESS